jgi:hypothetical protein
MIGPCSIAPSVLPVLLLRGPHGPEAQSLAPCGLCAEGSTMPTTELLTPSEIAGELRAIEGQLESLEERFAEVVAKVNATVNDLQFAAHKIVVALDRVANA